MKKILSALVIILFGYGAFPQSLTSSSSAKVAPNAFLDAAKKETSVIPASSVGSKAVRNFKKSFKQVANEQWYEMTDGFRAKFTAKGAQSDISYKVDYDKKGSWTHTIRTYNEKELARDIRDQVKMTYFDYAIVSVDEILMPRSQRTYVIHLEGATDWINVRVADGEMDEWQRYKK